MTSEVAVVDRRTGEILDLAGATDDQLAGYLIGAREVTKDLRDAERTVMEELIGRMDKAATWTVTVDGYKLSAPSPTAGSETYYASVLRDVLIELIDEETITEDAAARALQRLLTLTVEVPFGAALPGMAAKLAEPDTAIEIAGVPVRVVSVNHTEKPAAGQLKNLRKVPGVAAVLDTALAETPARPRTVTVKETL